RLVRSCSLARLEVARQAQRETRGRRLVVEAITAEFVIPTDPGDGTGARAGIQARRDPHSRIAQDRAIEVDRVRANRAGQARPLPAAEERIQEGARRLERGAPLPF